VRAILGLIDEPRAVGEMFNIGSAEEVTILELTRRIREYTGSSSDIQLVPFEKAFEKSFEDIPRRVPDTGKIRALIGWEPTKSLDDILHETIARTREEQRRSA
jgi:UDP-glucose 4-epimerase